MTRPRERVVERIKRPPLRVLAGERPRTLGEALCFWQARRERRRKSR